MTSNVQQFVPFKKVGTDISTKVANDAQKIDRLKPTINVETLAATRTLLVTDYLVQWLNPDGVTRDVIFPAAASSTNLMFILLNDGSQATFNLVCKNDAAATIATLGPGMSGIFSCDGTNWKWENNSGVLYDSVNKKVEIAGLLSQIGLGGSTYLGFEAGKVDDLSSNNNVGIGYQALLNVISGAYNIAMGMAALYSNTTGYENIAIGMNTLRFNTTGEHNTALGVESLLYNTTGNENTAVGMMSLHDNDVGNRNIALGYYAGYYEVGSDSFYINNQDRTNTATEKLQSIIYGIMAAAVADQHLTFNANVKINGMVGLNNVAPVGKAAHIADPTDLATAITAINAILVVLENLGAVATA